MGFEPKFSDLVTMFEESAAKFAERPLFGVKEDGRYRWITYADFGRQVAGFRAGLRRLGVGRGDRVAIIANNRPEWAVGAYATYGCGATYVAMYENQLDKEWQYILSNSEAKVCLVANQKIAARVEALLEALPALQAIVDLDGSEDEPHSFAALCKVGAESPAGPLSRNRATSRRSSTPPAPPAIPRGCVLLTATSPAT